MLIFACNDSSEVIPEDIAEKKEYLKQKKTELKELEKLVETITAEIEEIEPSKPKPRKLVTVLSLEKQSFKRYIEIQSTLESEDLVSVSAEMSGRLLKVNGKEGQYVRKGQLLAILDIETMNKQKAEIETALDLAKITFERQERLWKQNIGSEIQYLQAKNNKDRLEKSLETLEFQITKANVYAPISGVIDMELLKAGELAAAGQPIMQLLDMNRVKVVADVPENYLGSVKKGEYVSISIPALQKEINAKVTLIGRSIDPSNRTFKVEVMLPNSNKELKPNLLASMFINDLTLEDVIVIPQELVQQEISGNDFVYVAKDSEEGQKATKIYVITGESDDGKMVISEGLSGDELVINDGARKLSEGELIKFEN
jgi:RND family efflux transporter MFP subunit